MSSGVAKVLRSITTISWNGSYFTFTSFFTIIVHDAHSILSLKVPF
jgi:hypothetical protein